MAPSAVFSNIDLCRYYEVHTVSKVIFGLQLHIYFIIVGNKYNQFLHSLPMSPVDKPCRVLLAEYEFEILLAFHVGPAVFCPFSGEVFFYCVNFRGSVLYSSLSFNLLPGLLP